GARLGGNRISLSFDKARRGSYPLCRDADGFGANWAHLLQLTWAFRSC
ncbi:hypothetical protein pipiens_000923, partial [Culex pipiens pipiens]